MQDCMDGIISLAYGYENDTLMLNLKFGEALSEVEDKLANLNTFFV
jgi:hypothetical protein